MLNIISESTLPFFLPNIAGLCRRKSKIKPAFCISS